MKFIRKNGRIIPIKDGSGKSKSPEKGGSIHLSLVKKGVATGAAAGLALNAAAFGHKKTAIAFGAAALGNAIHGDIKNFENSIDHGKKKKSILHGIGRYITNGWSAGIGAGLGSGAVVGLSRIRKTGV